MNPKPIEHARDPDLRLCSNALLRAAQKARELAARTGTMIVVSGPRGIEKIHPVAGIQNVQEPGTPYDDAR